MMNDNSTGVELGTRLDLPSNMANDGAGGGTVNHLVRALDITAHDIMAHRSPTFVQYRAEFSETNCYVYAVGVSGDGENLKAGTGYAVMEGVNSEAGVKYVGTWERYRPRSRASAQIVMVNAEEDQTYFESASWRTQCGACSRGR